MHNRPEKLQIYPRGFLGTLKTNQVPPKATPFSNRYRELQFNWSLVDSRETRRTGDPVVEKLFAQMIRSEQSIDSHAFREKVFKAAFRLFGGTDFFFWYQAQNASPLLTDHHALFLEDTIGYLVNGKRGLNTISWLSLINLTQNEATKFEMSDNTKKFFGLPYPGSGVTLPKNRNTAVVLQSWWSKPAGVSDLLYTLHILFGDI